MFAGPSPSKLPASREQGFPALYEWLKAHNAEFDKASHKNLPKPVWEIPNQGRWRVVVDAVIGERE